MGKPNYAYDLHAHTTRSDGKDSPQELIDRASRLGLKAIAITDHDITPPVTIEVKGRSIPILDYAKSKDIILLRGMEISCDTENEDVHIVAFGCDFSDIRFQELEADVVKSKIESYRKFVELLNGNGYPITWDQVLTQQGQKIEPSQIQKKMIFAKLAELGYFPSWKEAKNFSQTHPEMNVMRQKPDPKKIIKLIHDTGGVSILAHPYLIQPDTMSTDDYIDRLIEAGLNGLEANYSYSKTNYRGNLSELEIDIQILTKCIAKGLLISGGTDYHGTEPGGVPDNRELGTNGITYPKFLKYGYLKYVV
jgi:predicted metal-dependent phosphoesterase TrpH